jgi:proline iminopeptidase
MSLARKVACLTGVGAAVYGFWLRPRLMRWGATLEEVATPYPGAELVPEGERAATMAVTIEAPPVQVWPWLVQMGGDRGGWYSWDRLDNGGRPSATEIHPEWQDLALGDYVKYWTGGRAVDAWQVAAFEPNRFLGLRGLMDLRGRRLDPDEPRPSAYVEGLWAFLLNELPGGRTRLVISGYQTMRPRWLGRFFNYWLYVLVTWPMQARMLAVLKRNIERVAQARMFRLPTELRPEAPLGCRL